jgi:hypothetical protein
LGITGKRYWRNTLVINNPELLNKLLTLWEEFSNKLGAFNFFSHESGCPAGPVYWEDVMEQPPCECGFDAVESKYFEISRAIRQSQGKRDARALRKSYPLVLERFKNTP